MDSQSIKNMETEQKGPPVERKRPLLVKEGNSTKISRQRKNRSSKLRSKVEQEGS